MSTTHRASIAVVAKNRYRAEALALSISAHSEHDTFPLTRAESSVLAQYSRILVELDANLESAMTIIRNTVSQSPDATVIVVGLVDSAESIVKLAEAGASGYVPANASFQELLLITQTAHKGEFACPPDVTFALFCRLSELAQNHDEDSLQGSGLTTRERQVMHLLALDLSNKEIANRLYVSECTVKNHVHHLLKKLGVRSRREAVRVPARFCQRS
jgi:two-component system nitrate/nitrite response regulator NarL